MSVHSFTTIGFVAAINRIDESKSGGSDCFTNGACQLDVFTVDDEIYGGAPYGGHAAIGALLWGGQPICSATSRQSL